MFESFQYITTVRRRGLLFFFNDTATTEIYTLSLHDALPISNTSFEPHRMALPGFDCCGWWKRAGRRSKDRKSTRLNSSHTVISYAVFCLKKIRHSLSSIWSNDSTALNGSLAPFLAAACTLAT